MNHKEDLIAGRNAVIEALRAKKPIDKIFVLDGCQDGPIRTIVREAKKTDAILKFVDKERLNQLTNEHHQGVVAIVAAYEYGTIEDLFKRAEEKGEDPFFILLDGIEDPHNLGAIIRTANLAGAHGVIIPKHRAVGITPTEANITGIQSKSDADSTANDGVPNGAVLKNDVTVQTTAASATVDETKATMTKHDDSGNAYINMQITNQKQFMLPMTGGAGNYLLIIAGVVVAGCGILILNKNRRRSQR